MQPWLTPRCPRCNCSSDGHHQCVIPAEAGIQGSRGLPRRGEGHFNALDSRLRGNDESHAMNTVHQRFATTAARAPRGEFLFLDAVTAQAYGIPAQPVTWGEAVAEVERLRAAYAQAGYGHGHRVGLLLENRQVAKVLASYVGENRLFAQQYLDGGLEVEFVPQGTLAERLRAGGAGIPAFYTPTGVGTPIAEGKQEAEFDGVRAILERGIVADLALVRAHRADAEGNLRYRLTARNFNPLVATAGRVTIAEADEILPEGEFVGPDDIHTPGIYVQHLVAADPADKEIEQRTLRSREA